MFEFVQFLRTNSRIWFQYHSACATIFDTQKSVATRRWYSLVGSLFFLLVIRLTLLYPDLIHDTDHYLKYDGFVELLEPKKNYDSKMDICLALFFIFFTYVNRFLYFKFANVGRSTIPHLLDINVINTSDILENNRQMFQRFRNWKLAFKKPREYLRQSRQLIVDLWNQNGPNIKPENLVRFGHKMKNFPNATREFRVRLFMILFGFEMFFVLMLLVTATGLIGAFSYYSYLMIMVHKYSYLQIGAVLLDMCYFSLIIWLAVKYALVIVIMVLAVLYTFSSQYLDLNRLLAKPIKCAGVTGKFIISQRLLNRRIWYFMREHRRITGYILVARNIWSTMFFLFILTNMPLNIYLVTFMYYRPVSTPIDKIFIFGILSTQVICSSIALLPIGVTAKAAHGSRKYFPRLQQSIIHHHCLKWKFMVLYEIVNSKDKIGYNAGPLGVVTINVLFEFFFVYTGYLMFVADMIDKA